jgi:hypothetical protein
MDENWAVCKSHVRAGAEALSRIGGQYYCDVIVLSAWSSQILPHPDGSRTLFGVRLRPHETIIANRDRSDSFCDMTPFPSHKSRSMETLYWSCLAGAPIVLDARRY